MARARWKAGSAVPMLLGAGMIAAPVHADTIISPGTIYDVGAAGSPSGFPDNGTVTVLFGGTLRVTGFGTFGPSYANPLTLSGSGVQDSSGSFLGALNAQPPALLQLGVPRFTGPISIVSDTLIRSDGATAVGSVYLLGTIAPSPGLSPTLTFAGAGTTAVTGNVTGNIALVKNDPGTLILAPTGAPNTFTGGVTLNSGTLEIRQDSDLGATGQTLVMFGNTGAQPVSPTLRLNGNIASSRPITFRNGGVKIIDVPQGTSSILSGAISGSGTLLITGPGTITLAGSNSSTAGVANPTVGGTRFSGGTLIIANADAIGIGQLFVNSGTVRTDGVLHTIDGKFGYTQSATATLQLRQLSASASESVTASIVSLAGTLQILPSGSYTPQSGDQFTVARGALVGQFDKVIGLPGFLLKTTYLKPAGSFPASDPRSFGSVVVQEFTLGGLATSMNGAAVGAAITRGASTGLPGALFATPGVFFGLSPDDPLLGRYLDELTPQRFQVFRNIAFDQAGFLASALDSWSAPEHSDRRWRGFGGATGTLASVGATEGVDHAAYESAGVVAGLDHGVGDHTRVGFLLGYASNDVRLDLEGSRATVRSTTPAIFATYRDGGLKLRALASYSFNDYGTRRRVLIDGTFDQRAHGETFGDSPSVSIGAGYDLARGSLTFGPTLDATFTHLHIDAFDESGASEASLRVSSQSADSFRTRLGGHVGLGQLAGPIGADITVAWQHEAAAGTASIAADFAQLGSGGFTTTLASLHGDAIYGAARLTAHVSGGVSGFVGYQIQASHRETAHSLLGGLRIAF